MTNKVYDYNDRKRGSVALGRDTSIKAASAFMAENMRGNVCAAAMRGVDYIFDNCCVEAVFRRNGNYLCGGMCR